MRDQHEVGLQCCCGRIVRRDELVNFRCPECRLAGILTKHDRPPPDRVSMSQPGQDYGMFSTFRGGEP